MKKIFLISIMAFVCRANAQVTSFNMNGITTGVKIDTVTPANSRPLPTVNLNTSGSAVNLATENTLQTVNNSILGVDTTLGLINGKLPATLGQKTMAGSLAVTVASDQSAIATNPNANLTGTYAEITNLTTVAQTFTAPANAVGFLIETLSSNTVNVRWKVGAAATTTSGMRLEPGRSEYIPLGANISVIAESGTNQVVTVQWVSK